MLSAASCTELVAGKRVTGVSKAKFKRNSLTEHRLVLDGTREKVNSTESHTSQGLQIARAFESWMTKISPFNLAKATRCSIHEKWLAELSAQSSASHGPEFCRPIVTHGPCEAQSKLFWSDEVQSRRKGIQK